MHSARRSRTGLPELTLRETRLQQEPQNEDVGRGQPDYAALKRDFDEGRIDEHELATVLSDAWAASYRQQRPTAELVEVDQGELTYLFDIEAARVVGVYGRAVPTTTPRPASRMRGFPIPAAANLIRGHLAAHSLGGGTDINLIPQDAALNVSGAWRRLERLAQANPGCLITVEATYDDESQTPAELTYLVAVSGALAYERFSNR